jgi:hypothetical protein
LASGGEWWRYPWKGHPFIVPVEPDGCVLPQDFYDVIGQMMVAAENVGWQFPHERE